MYKVSQMNPTLEYIYNHPKETKRIIGITYEQLIKLIAKAQIIESEKKEAIAKKVQGIKVVKQLVYH